MDRDFRMERISEVTELDNLEVLSEKDHEQRKTDKKVRKESALPKLPEYASSTEQSTSSQAQKFYGAQSKSKVRKSRSVPDVLSGTPLAKLNIVGATPTPENSPRRNSYSIKINKNKNESEVNGNNAFNGDKDFSKRALYNNSKNISKSLEDVSDRRVVRTRTDSMLNRSKENLNTWLVLMIFRILMS